MAPPRVIVVHRTVLAALFATGRLVRRKRDGAHHCNQNREQDFGVIFHGVSFVPNAGAASKNRTYSQDRRAIEWSSQTP
jgi:hypothetical protein